MISSCGACHEYSPALASGSHAKHFEYPELRQCYQCHNWSNSNDLCMACHDEATIEPRRDKHANGSVDVAFAPKYGGSYSGTPQPGDGYGSCSNTYCHSTGVSVAAATVPANTTPGWGFSGPLLCNACHGNETGNDGTGRPGYANGSPKANSHWSPSHVGSSCSACHYATTTTGTTITDKTKHVNNAYDVMPNLSSGITFTYTYAPTGGSCTTVSCHAGGATRTWGL
jgi:predicted CxxxxCH...CXXCH cytochrome family protein